MSGETPVTSWLRQLESGSEDAARLLLQRYYSEVVHLARGRFGATARRMVDEEDVALSAFRCLCDRASSGRLTAVVSRHDLWRLLAAITVRKVIDQQRIHMQAKRGGGRVRGDSALRGNGDEFANAGFDKLIGDAAPPEAFAIAREQFQRLMGILDNDGLRQIVQDKLDGYRNDEIGQRLGLSRRSIERKLQWIRYLWESELEQ